MKKEDAIIESLIFWSSIILSMSIVYYIGELVKQNGSEIPIFLCSTVIYMLYLILVRIIIKCKIAYRKKKNIPFNMVSCKFDVYASLITLVFYTSYMPSTNTGFNIDFSSSLLALIFGFIFGENILFDSLGESIKNASKRIMTLYNSIKTDKKEFLPSVIISGIFVLVTIADNNCPYWYIAFILVLLFLIVCSFVWFKLVPKLKKKSH